MTETELDEVMQSEMLRAAEERGFRRGVEAAALELVCRWSDSGDNLHDLTAYIRALLDKPDDKDRETGGQA